MNIRQAPDVNRKLEIETGIASFLDEFIALRRDIHIHPELAFKEHRTASLVADLLRQWGYEVTTGVGGTGVVGTLRRGMSTKPSASGPIWMRCRLSRRRGLNM